MVKLAIALGLSVLALLGTVGSFQWERYCRFNNRSGVCFDSGALSFASALEFTHERFEHWHTNQPKPHTWTDTSTT